MMLRMLLIAVLIGLAFASSFDGNNGYRPARHHHHHHRRPVHQQRAKHYMVALDQMIKRKPTAHFLGRNYVQQALWNQEGDNKFLKLNGKEERDINGTIAVSKNLKDVLVDLNESKEGHFVVENQKKKVVGRVDLLAATNKHLNMHRTKNGAHFIDGYQYGRAELNVERDLYQSRWQLRHGAKPQPPRHMTMHVVQNHDTQGHIHISAPKTERPQYLQYRYRRQAENPVYNPCRTGDCLNAVNAVQI